MVAKTKFYAPAMMIGGAMSLSLAFAAGSAQAVAINLDIAGANEFFDSGGTSTLIVSARDASRNVTDGNPVTLTQNFTIDGFTNGLDETRAIDRTLTFAVGDVSQSQTLAQTATVTGELVSIDGGGSPDNTRFRQRATLSDPDPLSFVFDGVGTFEVDVDGDSASTFFATTSETASGNLPVTVLFTAEATPEPEPDPSPIPLPAGLPLLIGALGAFGALRGMSRKS